MKKVLTVLLAVGCGFMAAEAAGAQQVSRANPQASVAVKPQTVRAATPSDRSGQRGNAALLAQTTPAVGITQNGTIVVTPPNPSNNEPFYPDSTLRAPMVRIGQNGEAGLWGRPAAGVYRTTPFRSVFPLDDADARDRLGVYIQANF